MQTIFWGILLFLVIVWMFIGTLFLWVQLRIVYKNLETAHEEKADRKEKQRMPTISQDQIEEARKTLVGRSKSYQEQAAEPDKEIVANPKDFPVVPAISSNENPANNPNTFAEQNNRPANDAQEEKEEDNEMDVAYTMDEPDEDSILREDLQLADESLPEVLPSSILSRDLSRVTSWHKNDNALDEENDAEVQGTLQAIRGTQLMDYIKEVTLKQEQDHQKLLAAIRKAEEDEMMDEGYSSADRQDDSDAPKAPEHPLSYYL